MLLFQFLVIMLYALGDQYRRIDSIKVYLFSKLFFKMKTFNLGPGILIVNDYKTRKIHVPFKKRDVYSLSYHGIESPLNKFKME